MFIDVFDRLVMNIVSLSFPSFTYFTNYLKCNPIYHGTYLAVSHGNGTLGYTQPLFMKGLTKKGVGAAHPVMKPLTPTLTQQQCILTLY